MPHLTMRFLFTPWLWLLKEGLKYLSLCALILFSSPSFSQINPVQITSYPFSFPTMTMASDTAGNLDYMLGYEYINSVKYNTRLYFVNAITHFTNTPVWFYAEGSGNFTTTWARRAFFSNNRLYFSHAPNNCQLICYDKPGDIQTLWQIKKAPISTIDDFELRNDSVFVMIDSSNTTGYKSLCIFNKNTGAFISGTSIKENGIAGDYVFGVVKKIKLFNGKLLVGGKFDGAVNYTTTINNFLIYDIATGKCLTTNLNINDTVNDIEIYNNRIYVAGSFSTVAGQVRNNWAVLNSNFSLHPQTFNINGPIKEMEFHGKDMFIATTATTIQSTPVVTGYSLNAVLIDVNTALPYKWISPFLGSYPTVFKIANHRLFMGDQNGVTNKAFCLTPVMPAGFSVATSSLCQGAGTFTYSYNSGLGASTYSWSYSGTGASLSANTKTATINFGLTATSGTLMAWTQSFCGNKSDTIKLNITVYPRPTVSISTPGGDTINCLKPKVRILCNSSQSTVNYSWTGPFGYTSTLKDDSTGYKKPGTYSCTVTNSLTGCSNGSSVLVKLDTVKPNVTVPSTPVFIKCNPDSSLLDGSSSSSPTAIWWRFQGSSMQHPDPYYTKAIGNYFMVVRNTKNGCRDSSLFVVQQNTTPPNASLASHTYSNPVTPIDTVTCLTPSINVLGASSTTNTGIQWKSIPGNTVYSNPITVTVQGNFKLIVTDNTNGCADSSIIVLVAQDLTPPLLTITTVSPGITCSNLSTTLNAVCSVTNAALQWTGPSSFTSANPATVINPGWYYISAVNPGNGCSKNDSVNVSYNSSLLVNAGNDVTVCKNSLVNLSAGISGTVSSITYSWSNGASGPSITVTPSLSTSYIVYASDGASCNGQDTVIVSIPADLQDSIVGAKACDGTNFGSIAIFVKGGIPPYQYSFNNGSFTSQSTYTGIPYGTYPIIIKDSLGCLKNSSGTINQSSALPEPLFIASTKNIKGDTLVLVDLTTPKPDSVQWILPASATRIGGDMFNPVIVFGDTGSFSVSIKAFYGNCTITRSKLIHVAPADSTLASLYNANGIKSLTLYPNPNNGQFTVVVEFYKKQNSSIQVWNTEPQKFLQQNFLDSDYISLPVSLTQLQNGNYILKVIGEYNAKHLHFVISK